MKKMACFVNTVRKHIEQKLGFLEGPFNRFKISGVTKNKGVDDHFSSSL